MASETKPSDARMLNSAPHRRFGQDTGGGGSTLSFVIAGVTVTVGGLLAWFAFGWFMMVLGSMPGLGLLGLAGFLTIVGVVVVLGFVAHARFGGA